MLKSAKNFVALLGRSDPEHWHPLLSVYYVTYACRYRCPYCCDGSGVRYSELKESHLPVSAVMELLSVIRRYSEHLVLTGGEPLQHPQIADILLGVKSLRFESVILTTNGDRYSLFADEIASSVTHLVFSLDTLNESLADQNFGVGPGALRRLLKQIDHAAQRDNRRYQVVISSVATPQNLDDLHAVYDYCRENRFLFAVCPQLVGTVAHRDLQDNQAYRKLFTRLLADKRKGARINGSIEYLEHMRDLAKFECVPSATLAVSPSGNVFYPCLERGTFAGNLLEIPNLDELRKHARKHLGGEPRCGRQCHSACALGFSLLLKRPWSCVREGCLQALSSFS